MCRLLSNNIDNYQAFLKAFIQHYGTTLNALYTSVIKKYNTLYHCNDNQIMETNLNQEINHAYIKYINFNTNIK